MHALHPAGSLALLIALLAFGPAVGGVHGADDSGPVEVENEPHHHVVFENAAVRILEVSIPAGTRSQYHRHRRDNAAVALVDIVATNQRLGEALSPPTTRRPGGMNYSRAPGEGYVHQVTNVGATPFRVVDIEFLGTPAAAAAPDPAAPAPFLDTERFRARSIAIPPGQASTPFRMAAGVQVVVNGLRLVQIEEDGAPHPLDVSAHPWQWRDAGVVSLRNESDSPALVVEVEIK